MISADQRSQTTGSINLERSLTFVVRTKKKKDSFYVWRAKLIRKKHLSQKRSRRVSQIKQSSRRDALRICAVVSGVPVCVGREQNGCLVRFAYSVYLQQTFIVHWNKFAAFKIRQI